jgi:hypothetical protein
MILMALSKTGWKLLSNARPLRMESDTKRSTPRGWSASCWRVWVLYDVLVWSKGKKKTNVGAEGEPMQFSWVGCLVMQSRKLSCLSCT